MNRKVLRIAMTALSAASLVFAIVGCASPWIHFYWSTPGADITTNVGLWRMYQSSTLDGASFSQSANWPDDDRPFCPDTPTPTNADILARMRWAQWLSVVGTLAVFFGLVISSLWMRNPASQRAFRYVV